MHGRPRPHGHRGRRLHARACAVPLPRRDPVRRARAGGAARAHPGHGGISFTSDYADAADADVHFLCVGTPQRKGEYAADLTWLDGAVEALAPLLARATLIVGKSTVPVGTAARLRRRLQQVTPAGDDVHLLWNPEFLREGFAVRDTVAPDRFVYGVAGPGAADDVALLDRLCCTPLDGDPTAGDGPADR